MLLGFYRIDLGGVTKHCEFASIFDVTAETVELTCDEVDLSAREYAIWFSRDCRDELLVCDETRPCSLLFGRLQAIRLGRRFDDGGIGLLGP